jgi:glutamyl-tRNA reductase
VSPRKLWLVGVSHHSAPVALRERLALDDAAAAEVGQRLLRQVPGLDECALVSTCNRVEVIGFGDPAASDPTSIVGALQNGRPLGDDQLRSHVYVHEDRAAVRHLFRVASSLDSLVVGEPQILGQVKAFYEAAVRAGTAGAILHRVFHKAFSAAKRVRSETGIGGRNVSVSSVAVELAMQIFESLSEKTALMIGAGKMAELAARHFRDRGIGGLMFANRTFDRGVELARELHGTPVPFEELGRYLPMADVVIGSTAATEFLLTEAQVQEALRLRGYRPTFLIDLGVPRNFDPRINDLRNVYLYDIDDLESVIGENREERGREAARAEEIVSAEVESFWRWFENLEVVPTIVGLRDKAERIRRRELDRTLGALKHLGDEERKSIEAMAEAIVNKLLHEPIARLKRVQGPDDEAVLMARRLFGLDDLDDDD